MLHGTYELSTLKRGISDTGRQGGLSKRESNCKGVAERIKMQEKSTYIIPLRHIDRENQRPQSEFYGSSLTPDIEIYQQP